MLFSNLEPSGVGLNLGGSAILHIVAFWPLFAWFASNKALCSVDLRLDISEGHLLQLKKGEMTFYFN